ncbi:MAG: hypothetical protein ACHQJ6_01160 [Candidatus Berkiellales bacterium]
MEICERKFMVRAFIVIYMLLLLSVNFVGDHSERMFYFTYSIATPIIQFAFCGLIVLTEILGIRKTQHVLLATTIIHLLVGLFVHFGLGWKLPNFWISNDIEPWRQGAAILMFVLCYVCCALAMVGLAAWLKVVFGRHWLLVRVGITVVVGVIVDLLMLYPIVLFVTPDHYMALWKLLALVSIKLPLCIVEVPLTYLVILAFKRNHKFLPKARLA